jgi:hypothetical protein
MGSMHAFLRPIHGADHEITGYAFWYPGCATVDPCHGLHVFTVKAESGDAEQEWSFDGHDSFEPSLAYETDPNCHLHLTQGMIRYYPDCSHALAGEVAPLGQIPPDGKLERCYEEEATNDSPCERDHGCLFRLVIVCP